MGKPKRDREQEKNLSQKQVQVLPSRRDHLLISFLVEIGEECPFCSTMDARTLVGFVVQESADKVTIRDNQGKEFVLPVNSIEQRSKQTTSVMPEGLVKEITPRDLASLLDYLESFKKP